MAIAKWMLDECGADYEIFPIDFTKTETELLPEIESLYPFYSIKDFIGSNDAFEVLGLNNCGVDSISSAKEGIRMHQIARRLDFFPAYRNRIREKHQQIVDGVKSFRTFLARGVDVKNFLQQFHINVGMQGSLGNPVEYFSRFVL
jgi:hypothetical protein